MTGTFSVPSLNPPENSSPYVYGRKHSAPTVNNLIVTLDL